LMYILISVAFISSLLSGVVLFVPVDLGLGNAEPQVNW
jgi:hypothetical protein